MYALADIGVSEGNFFSGQLARAGLIFDFSTGEDAETGDIRTPLEPRVFAAADGNASTDSSLRRQFSENERSISNAVLSQCDRDCGVQASEGTNVRSGSSSDRPGES